MKSYLFIVVLLAVMSCNDSGNHKNDINNEPVSENFSQFMQKFINEPDFRLRRVNFPLAGSNSDDRVVGETQDNYLWTKGDWLFYAEEDFRDNPDKNIRTESIDNDTTAMYRLYRENSGYDVRYNFELKEGKWYLVNYSYQNI